MSGLADAWRSLRWAANNLFPEALIPGANASEKEAKIIAKAVERQERIDFIRGDNETALVQFCDENHFTPRFPELELEKHVRGPFIGWTVAYAL